MRPILRRCALVLAVGAGDPAGAAGPDLVVANIHQITNWTSTPVNGMRAYSFAPTTCNIGDLPASWNGNTAQHPLMTQNLHRISNGRVEQLGMSFVYHGFTALGQNFCGVCQPTGDPFVLGVGCSTVEQSHFFGEPNSLGPRSGCNASTGACAWPYAPSQCAGMGALCEKLFASEADLSVPGAVYLAEMIVVQFQDAAAGNTANNTTCRRILIHPTTFNATFAAPAEVGASAVDAWKAHGLGPGQPDASILVAEASVLGDGRFVVGSRATNIGAGLWRYEYAVENVNSDRGAGSFRVPIGNASVGAIGFRDVNYHSGEVYDPTDWNGAVVDGAVQWSSPATHAQNPNSNALRWGTLYNFRFEAASGPIEGPASIGCFKPGAPAAIEVGVRAPGLAFCPTDIDGDGSTGFADLNEVLDLFGAQGVEAGADVNGDGSVDFADLNLLLGEYGVDCHAGAEPRLHG